MSIVEEIVIQRNKELNDAILGEIQKIATKNGIAIQLNEKAIVNALEKQIPKKPEYWGDGYADGVLCYDYAKCPICERDFEEGINDWGCKYCADCGQALDWSVSNNETD